MKEKLKLKNLKIYYNRHLQEQFNNIGVMSYKILLKNVGMINKNEYYRIINNVLNQ